jgi:dipeptidyl aminopeptidase/acylaminoacyl peptidase
MAYGKNDTQVRIDQGYGMAAALKQAGKTFEMVVEEKEGHGFRKEELSIAFYTRVDAFLKKYVLTPRGSVNIGEARVIGRPANE